MNDRQEPTMKGVTQNPKANELIGQRNAELKAATADAERDEIIARYTALIAAAKDGEPSEGELERIAENVSTPNWMRV